VIIVAGWFEIEPSERDAFLASHAETMRTSRAEPGNLDYVMAADPIDPARVVLFEQWDDDASIDAHLAALRDARGSRPAPTVTPRSMSVMKYAVSDAAPLT
jgi:quinol monooxygenase YgiN